MGVGVCLCVCLCVGVGVGVCVCVCDGHRGVVSPQIMSLEDVEKIMDETQEAVEYQRVRPLHPCGIDVLITTTDDLGNR